MHEHSTAACIKRTIAFAGDILIWNVRLFITKQF